MRIRLKIKLPQEMTRLFIIMMIMLWYREGKVAAAKYTHDDYVEDREMTKNKNMRIMFKITFSKK